MNQHILRAWLLLSVLLISNTTWAQSEPDPDGNMVRIRTIGVAPYGIADPSNPGGIYYDLANMLADRAGLEAEHKILPYARIIRELKAGKTDLTIMFKYKQLEGHVVYLAPLPALQTVVVGRAGTDFEDPASLRGKKLAYLRGARFSDAIDSDPAIIREEITDYHQGLKMLVYKRLDAVIGPLEPILFAAQTTAPPDFRFGAPLVVDERTPWLQVSRKTSDRLPVEKLRAIFLAILADSSLPAIREKYVRARPSG